MCFGIRVDGPAPVDGAVFLPVKSHSMEGRATYSGRDSQHLDPGREGGRLDPEQLGRPAATRYLAIRSPQRDTDVVRLEPAHFGVGQQLVGADRNGTGLQTVFEAPTIPDGTSIASRPPSAVMTARSITCCNSLTFPGQ